MPQQYSISMRVPRKREKPTKSDVEAPEQSPRLLSSRGTQTSNFVFKVAIKPAHKLEPEIGIKCAMQLRVRINMTPSIKDSSVECVDGQSMSPQQQQAEAVGQLKAPLVEQFELTIETNGRIKASNADVEEQGVEEAE